MVFLVFYYEKEMAEIIDLIESLKKKMSDERGNLAENHAKLAALETEAKTSVTRYDGALEALGIFSREVVPVIREYANNRECEIDKLRAKIEVLEMKNDEEELSDLEVETSEK